MELKQEVGREREREGKVGRECIARKQRRKEGRRRIRGRNNEQGSDILGNISLNKSKIKSRK